VVGAVVGAVAGVVAGFLAGAAAAAGNDMSTNVLLTLTAGLGTSFGIGCIVGLLNPYVLLAIALTGLPLATMLLYPLLKRRKLVAKYRQSESRLIKP
jgi:heme exporter protein D